MLTFGVGGNDMYAWGMPVHNLSIIFCLALEIEMVGEALRIHIVSITIMVAMKSTTMGLLVGFCRSNIGDLAGIRNAKTACYS